MNKLERVKKMPESTVQTFIAVLLSKLLHLIMYMLGPVVATVVVMLLTKPESKHEWFAALFSTVMTSMGLGAVLIKKYIGHVNIDSTFDLMMVGGVFFACGLPGWLCVRALFFYGEHSKEKSIIDILKEIRGILK